MRKFLNKIEFITITAIFFIFLLLFFTSENSFLLLDSNISESTMKKKETPAKTIPKQKETPAKTIPEQKETPAKTIPEQKETPAKTIPEQKETPAKAIPEQKETPAKVIPEQQEIPAIIAMTMAKIMSEKNLLSSEFIFIDYEEKNWETSSMGCSKNGLFYQNKQTSGYILESLINGEKIFYHINSEGEYINCTETNLYNNQSNLNFVEKFQLDQTKAIVVSIHENNNTLAVIDEKEEVTKIINSLNVNILNEKVEDCETLYDLTFLKAKENIVFNVFCTSNKHYVYNNEPFYAAELFINVLEPILADISFPGLPNE